MESRTHHDSTGISVQSAANTWSLLAPTGGVQSREECGRGGEAAGSIEEAYIRALQEALAITSAMPDPCCGTGQGMLAKEPNATARTATAGRTAAAAVQRARSECCAIVVEMALRSTQLVGASP
ncbi:unnamed protein product [Nezara viridula]|uniref:Uncharacterized protein n=1 Tax=Nezara viridula TaxID=85310 RepID=A0A9P0H4W6_NEZVI|nr:unnamed protein product [Nezara viridula]